MSEFNTEYMMNKHTSEKCCILFSGLFSLLSFFPLDSTAETGPTVPGTLPEIIYDASEHFSDIESADLEGLLERIGDSRVVLIGEASHGTAEFYDMRARITRELIKNKGFNIIAAEADWPDAESIDRYIHGAGQNPFHHTRKANKPFAGFPTWMWANHSVSSFLHWLKNYNQSVDNDQIQVNFYGLDFYNIFGSIRAVIEYLRHVDPQAAKAAYWSYTCLMPWISDPSLYGRDIQSGRYSHCGHQVFAVMRQLQKKRAIYQQADGSEYFNAFQNARLIVNGEYFYRSLYRDNNDSWNQRDQNMFESLLAILKYNRPASKVVVWAHNSHIGDARATDRREYDEINLGQLVRETFADSSYLIGFGTDHGTVAAATRWGDPVKFLQIKPSHPDSYGHLFHEVRSDSFLLPLRDSILRNPVQAITRKKLLARRLQRAIGTTYDPDDELKKHYIYVSLPRQFDEYIWFDNTHAVKPLHTEGQGY
jgi:erythromycin esterase-like protein